MMDAEDEPPTAPTPVSPCSPSAQLRLEDEPCGGFEEREMFHFRRPDISTRRVFFQRRNSNGALPSPTATTASAEPAVPVQLLTMDGQCYFGTPYTANVEASRSGGALPSNPPASPRNNPQEDRLARVSSRLVSIDCWSVRD